MFNSAFISSRKMSSGCVLSQKCRDPHVHSNSSACGDLWGSVNASFLLLLQQLSTNKTQQEQEKCETVSSSGLIHYSRSLLRF